MILNEFEKMMSRKWEEFILWDSTEKKRLFYSRPLPLAFMELESAGVRDRSGEVVINSELEKHWNVIMQEYSISRQAAEVLMFIARRYPTVVKLKVRPDKVNRDYQIIKEGLDELTNAGVVDKKSTEAIEDYELSHDLLASVVFGRNFAQMWKETQRLRSTRRLLEEYKSSHQSDDDII